MRLCDIRVYIVTYYEFINIFNKFLIIAKLIKYRSYIVQKLNLLYN